MIESEPPIDTEWGKNGIKNNNKTQTIYKYTWSIYETQRNFRQSVHMQSNYIDHEFLVDVHVQVDVVSFSCCIR